MFVKCLGRIQSRKVILLPLFSTTLRFLGGAESLNLLVLLLPVPERLGLCALGSGLLCSLPALDKQLRHYGM